MLFRSRGSSSIALNNISGYIVCLKWAISGAGYSKLSPGLPASAGPPALDSSAPNVHPFIHPSIHPTSTKKQIPCLKHPSIIQNSKLLDLSRSLNRRIAKPPNRIAVLSRPSSPAIRSLVSHISASTPIRQRQKQNNHQSNLNATLVTMPEWGTPVNSSNAIPTTGPEQAFVVDTSEAGNMSMLSNAAGSSPVQTPHLSGVGETTPAAVVVGNDDQPKVVASRACLSCRKLKVLFYFLLHRNRNRNIHAIWGITCAADALTDEMHDRVRAFVCAVYQVWSSLRVPTARSGPTSSAATTSQAET